METTVLQKSQEKESAILEMEEKVVELLKNLAIEKLGCNAHNFTLSQLSGSLREVLKKAEESASRQIIESQDPQTLQCSDCGAVMEIKDAPQRTIQGFVTYRFKRRLFFCPSCKRYERPLDDQLACQGRYTVELREALLLLGQQMPFEVSSFYAQKLLHVHVSHATIRGLVEGVGARITQAESRRVSQTLNEKGFIKDELWNSPDSKIPDIAYLQMDGSMVQTRECGWKEVKVGELYAQKDNIEIDKHHHHILRKTYFAVFNGGDSSLEKFKQQATVTAHDFGFQNYQTQVVLGDGAPWIWEYASLYHPEAIQILDYYHACEYLGNALVSLRFDDQDEFQNVKKKQLFDWLEQGDIRPIISFLENQTPTTEVMGCVRYFEHHIERMNYGKYRQLGCVVGSGAIESAHRIVVQSRMKQSGMHWGKDNVQSILSLKTKYLSGEWDSIISNYLDLAA